MIFILFVVVCGFCVVFGCRILSVVIPVACTFAALLLHGLVLQVVLHAMLRLLRESGMSCLECPLSVEASRMHRPDVM